MTPIGRGTILSRLWDQPADHGHRHRRAERRERVEHARPPVTVVISARDRARADGAATAFAALEAHLARERAVRRARRDFATSTSATRSSSTRAAGRSREAQDAMHEAWGVEPVETGVGGSIPFIADLVEVFPEAQILVTGVEDPDARAHSPNESLHLGVFRRAILTEALLLAKLETARSVESD